MPLAYDVHPEFGYFGPGPRFRRELRIAVVSVLFGLVIGAVIVTLRAGHAVETDGISSKAHRTSSGPDTGVPSVAGPSLQLENVDKAVSDAGGASAFEQDCVTHCRDSARPYRATGAGYCTSLRGSGVARERRGPGVASGFTAGAIIRRNCRTRRLRDQEATKRYACETSSGRRE